MAVKRFVAVFTVILFLTAASAAAAQAACDTWNGGTGYWGTASNWSTNTVPSGTDVCINAGEVIFVPYVTGGQTIYQDTVGNVSIGSGATLEIEGENSNYGGDYYEESDLSADNISVASGAQLLLDSTANSAPAPADSSVPNGANPGGAAKVYVGSSGTNGTLTNDGTVVTESSDPLYGEFLQGPIQNAGSLTDASGVLTLQDVDGVPITNTGTMTIAAGASTSLTGSPGLTNSGSIVATGSLAMGSAQTWTQSAGSVSGSTVTLASGDTLADSAGPASFEFLNGNYSSAISGTIPTGQTVTLATSADGGNAILATSGSVTNDGTFVIDTETGSTGNPEIDSGAAGDAFLNHGTIETQGASPTYNSLFRVPLTNASGSTFDVQSGKVFLDAGNTTTNDGSIVIAPGAQYLQQNGALVGSGTLDPQIASATQFGYYGLDGGTFADSGSLSPSLVGGYKPAAGKEFSVLGLAGGTFSSKFGRSGNGFSVDYSHETTTPAYVGAVYGGSASATKRVKVGKVTTKDGKLVVKLSCAKGARCAAYSLTATVTEHFRGKKLTAVTARASAAQAAAARTSTKVITIASAKGSVSAGKTVTRTLSLNKAGAALLKKLHKLKTLVRVRAGKAIVSSKTLTLTQAKRK